MTTRNVPDKNLIPRWLAGAVAALIVLAISSSFTFIYTLQRHLDGPHATSPVEYSDFDALRDEYDRHVATGEYKHRIIDNAFEAEKETINQLREFMEKGGRFTKEDGNKLADRIRRVENRLNRCQCEREQWMPPIQRNELIPGIGKQYTKPVIKREQ